MKKYLKFFKSNVERTAARENGEFAINGVSIVGKYIEYGRGGDERILNLGYNAFEDDEDDSSYEDDSNE